MREAPATVEEQVRASNPMTSAWVGANAGSGKTHVLVQRMLRLLLAGVEPATILCLTFTRAAAVEMSKRLFERLGSWVSLEELALTMDLEELLGSSPSDEQLKTSRLLFARVLDTPEELRIQTIHAFCEKLLKRFPIEARVPAQFRVLDEHESRELRLSARDRLLRELASAAGKTDGLAQAVATICADITDDEFSRLLAAIDENRQQIRVLLPDSASVDRQAKKIFSALKIGKGEKAVAIEARIANPGAARAKLLEAAQVLQAQSKSFRETGRKIQGFLSSDADPVNRPRLKEYLSAFFTGKGDRRQKLARKDTHSSIVEALHDEQERLESLQTRYALCRTAERSRAVLRLSHRMVDGFEEEKLRLGALDFDDLIEYAAALLRRSEQAAWVLYKLDQGITHILIDEAQDTSPRQWDVVSALVEEFFSGKGRDEDLYDVVPYKGIPRSLFAVGDEKQSIFRFQGADLEVYDRQRRDFGTRITSAALSWEEVPLQLSFRSTPEVLQAVDLVFTGKEGKESVSASGAEISHLAHRKEEKGLVELWEPECMSGDKPSMPNYWELPDPDQASNGEEPHERLARRIAGCIRGWMDNGELLASRRRTIRPGDIMILVQRRAGFVEEMIHALKRQNIPVAGADRLRLSEHLAIMDLLSLGRACLLRSDDLSLAESLKSPLFGLDDCDLFNIAHDRGEYASLWDALRKHGKRDRRLGEIVERLSKLRFLAVELSPFVFYHQLLVNGGREKLLERLGSDAADPIDAFLGLLRAYEREHVQSLQGFLRWLERSGAEIKRDQDSTRDEVQVVTVHGAKGLESEILFLPDTCRRIGHWSHDPVLYFGDKGNPDEPPMVWAPSMHLESNFSAKLRHEFREEERRENWRLLYVAMTRARDRLYICGHTRRPEPPGDCWYTHCLGALQQHMREHSLADGQRVWRLGEAPASPSLKGRKMETEEVEPARRPDFPWLEPERNIPSLAPSRALVSRERSSGWGEDFKQRLERQRGVILHEALRRLSILPPESRLSAVGKIITVLAPETEPPEREGMIASLRRVLKSRECQCVFAWPGRNEVPLSGFLDLGNGGGVVRIPARVDRICFPSEGEVMAVEYKSDRLPPGSVAKLREGYLKQVGIYYRLLQKLWPKRKIRCSILWLETAKFMEIPFAMLEKEGGRKPTRKEEAG